jgi:hypothetical protein
MPLNHAANSFSKPSASKIEGVKFIGVSNGARPLARCQVCGPNQKVYRGHNANNRSR